jgi:5-methyltetrahydropteroyltriglutamate--homocysteine methyltransferase
MITAHSDVVGSLLRPAALLKARGDYAAGRLTPAEFKRVEDWAVDEAIRLQEEAGLAVVTDGEQRRLSFQSRLLESVEGVGNWTIDAFLWGDWKGDERIGNRVPGTWAWWRSSAARGISPPRSSCISAAARPAFPRSP